jgi:hypothetical protein
MEPVKVGFNFNELELLGGVPCQILNVPRVKLLKN